MKTLTASFKSALMPAAVISGPLYLLSLQKDMISLAVTILSAVIGISAVKSCCKCVTSAKGAFIFSFIACYGGFLTLFWSHAPISYAGSMLTGLAAGSAFFAAFSAAAFGSLQAQNETAAGLSLSSALAIASGLKIFSEHLPYGVLIFVFLLMAAGLTRIKAFHSCQADGPCLSSANRDKDRKKSRPLCLFLLFTGLAASMVLSMAWQGGFAGKSAAEKDGALFLTAIGLIAGPLLTAAFSGRKGVFSGAVLNIFLPEASILLFTFYGESPLTWPLRYILLGMTLTAPLALCPLLVYYLFGPFGYGYRLGGFFQLLIASFTAFPAISMLGKTVLFSYPFILAAFFLLVCSFFTVFSAWKHRLVLLKSQ